MNIPEHILEQEKFNEKKAELESQGFHFLKDSDFLEKDWAILAEKNGKLEVFQIASGTKALKNWEEFEKKRGVAKRKNAEFHLVIAPKPQFVRIEIEKIQEMISEYLNENLTEFLNEKAVHDLCVAGHHAVQDIVDLTFSELDLRSDALHTKGRGIAHVVSLVDPKNRDMGATMTRALPFDFVLAVEMPLGSGKIIEEESEATFHPDE